jgi:hypothetical protein
LRSSPSSRTQSACTASVSPSTTSTPPSRFAARQGCHPLRGVASYEDVYKLTYLRGPSGILVMFAEELKKED